MTTITIGEHTWTPQAPDDYALAADIAGLSVHNLVRAYAAAIVATWRGPNRPKVSFRQHGFSAGSFGGACLNELHRRGMSVAEVIEVGTPAFVAVMEQFVPADEVRATEDFTEADEVGKSDD